LDEKSPSARPVANCVNTGTADPCLYPILTTANSGQTRPITDETGSIYTSSFRPPSAQAFRRRWWQAPLH
jgi:hypothetical protein